MSLATIPGGSPRFESSALAVDKVYTDEELLDLDKYELIILYQRAVEALKAGKLESERLLCKYKEKKELCKAFQQGRLEERECIENLTTLAQSILLEENSQMPSRPLSPQPPLLLEDLVSPLKNEANVEGPFEEFSNSLNINEKEGEKEVIDDASVERESIQTDRPERVVANRPTLADLANGISRLTFTLAQLVWKGPVSKFNKYQTKWLDGEEEKIKAALRGIKAINIALEKDAASEKDASNENKLTPEDVLAHIAQVEVPLPDWAKVLPSDVSGERSAQPSTVIENPMLATMFEDPRIVGITVTSELIQKLKIRMPAKKEQLTTSRQLLREWRAEKSQGQKERSKSMTALTQEVNEKIQAEMEKGAKEIEERENRKEAKAIAKQVLWDAMDITQRNKIAIDHTQKPAGESPPENRRLKQLFWSAYPATRTAYLEKLRAHSDYETKLKKFADKIEVFTA